MTLNSIHPLLASGALQFAFEKATVEGKITIGVLLALSLFSWTIIIAKTRQLSRARRQTKRFLAAYNQAGDPLDLKRRGDSFPGAPAWRVYVAGAGELEFHLQNGAIAARGDKRVTMRAFEAVKSSLEEEAATSALSLEKGMIVLSTAVAGGPFIGLLGTVWGVMETFAGIARSNAASLTAMAPGVAGALIATVIGLLVAIPAMFAYNFMVTSIRSITHELDGFAARFATRVEHQYVDTRPLSEEISDSHAALVEKLASALRDRDNSRLAEPSRAA
jgi:biopolymer transport protein ExbB/TolQ